MFVDIDYSKRKKGYKIHLAKPNKEIISVLSESYDPTYNVKLGNVNELTFSIPYYIDKESEREYNKNIDLIKEKMYIRIKYNGQKEWMLIDSLEDIGEGDSKTLVVNAFSNVYENRGKRIPELQLEAVNPKEYFDTILEDTAWVLGQVDGTFTNMYRTFDINDSTTLEAILEGGSTFGAILDFDSENRKINLIDMNKNAEYRGLKINYNNFLNSINRKRDTDSMATRLYVYGSEDLSISRVNPTGMNYLEDFSYFLEPFKRDENKNVLEHSHYMSDELAHAILDMEELTKEYAPQIQSKQLQMDEMTIELINLETQLTNLTFDKSTIQGLLEIAKATGDTNLIAQRQQELSQAEVLVKNKQTEVEDLGKDISRIDQEIINMQNSISVTSFTKELRDELNPFIIESEFRDDRYVDDAELYDDAVKKFEEAKTPNIVIDASIENIIDSLEEDYFSDKIVLGDLARVVDKDMNIDYKSVIIELSFNLDNEECQLVIANNTDDKDGFDDVLSVLYNTQSTTSRLEASKNKWDSVTELRTEVDIMREEGIDAVRRRITAGVNESVEISERGVVLTNPDFPDEMVIMQAGVIALSTDGGENWSTSITPHGVIADTVIGRLVASNNLIITNESGSFKIDSDGMTVDMDSIKIMSGSGETPQNMIDSWNQVILTMEDFANDSVLNEYEKNQIDKQWKSIMVTHASMIQVAQDAYGPESEENPYPIEYDRYLEAYENLNNYLNVTKQSDGHPILDPATRNQTTPIDSAMYESVINEYQKNKDIFQTVIPLDFAQSSIEVLEAGIALTYVKNGEVATQLNLSEEGVKIDGRLLEINSKTAFNDDLVMNAGVIRSKDNSIVIDLNAGTINLTKPLTINAVPVVTQDDLDDLSLESGKSAYEIAVDFGFEGTESEWLESLQGPRGEQGIGIDGESAYMHIAWADNADGTIGFTQINTANKMFMGVYTDNNPQSSALPTKYKWTKIKGEDAPTVKLSGETQVIKVDKDGNITPSSTFVVQGVGINTSITQWTYAVNGGDFSSSQPIGVSRDGNIVTISPQTSTFQILTVRAGDGKVFDEFSIARTNDGVSGKDAYTALLSNESHTFAENSAGILAGSVATRIIAYKGTTPIPVTINSVTGLPTGLTSSISQNNTVNATVTFTANNSLTESSGTVQIRFELEGKSMSKEFSYAVALKGDKGEKGDDGTSITSVDVEYSQSTSATTAPKTGWSTTAPTWKDGQYIWSRTKTTYSSGSPTYSNPAVITGQKGGTGATGSAGRGISSIVEQYYLSTSKTTREGGTWVEEPPTWVSGRYMWTRSKINYTNPTGTEYTTPVVDSAWEALEGVTLKDKDYQVGTEVFTDKADDNSVVHVDVDGKSVGGGTKNLFNLSWYVALEKDRFSSGTYSLSSEGGLVVNRADSRGTAKSEYSYYIPVKPSTTYTFSTDQSMNWRINEHNASGALVINQGQGGGNSITFTTSSSTVVLTTKFYPASTAYPVTVRKIQLEEGSTVTPYEPEAIPTPDYPIAINSLNNVDVVSSVGKENLLTGTTSEWRSNSVSNGGYASFHHGLIKFSDVGLKEGDTVTFSLVLKTNSSYGVKARFEQFLDNDRRIMEVSDAVYAESDLASVTVTIKHPYNQFRVGVQAGQAPAPEQIDYEYRLEKLEIKGVNTLYSPSPEDIQPDTPTPTIYKTNISLPEPLRSVGDVKDRLFRDTDGLWKVERNVGERIFTGQEVWGTYASQKTYTYNLYEAKRGYQTSITSHFINKNGAWNLTSFGVGDYSDHTTVDLRYFNSDKATVTDFKTWLSEEYSKGTPLTITFVLATPTIETLPDDLQQKLSNIQSYGATSGNVFSMKEEYYVSTSFQGFRMKLKPNRAYVMTTNIPDSSGINFNTFFSSGRVAPSHILNGVSENFPRTVYTDSTGEVSVAVRVGTMRVGLDNGTYWIRIQEVPITNYVYTTSNLEPTLYTTFKSRGWYDKYLTETELKLVNDKADSKADQEQVDKVAEDLSNFETIVATKEELGEIITSLNEYATMLDSNETSLQQASKDISNLLNRVPILENNLGTFTENWNFLDTYMTAGEEGLIIGSQGSNTAIRISDNRIDFMDGAGEPVAFITNQIMQINRGIFVQSATIGQHKIETITGGHTIWQWVPPS